MLDLELIQRAKGCEFWRIKKTNSNNSLLHGYIPISKRKEKSPNTWCGIKLGDGFPLIWMILIGATKIDKISCPKCKKLQPYI